MEKMRLSEKMNITNFKRVAALLLVLMMLVGMIGCKKDVVKDNSSNNSSTQSQSNNDNSSQATPSTESSDVVSNDSSSDNTSNDNITSDVVTDNTPSDNNSLDTSTNNSSNNSSNNTSNNTNSDTKPESNKPTGGNSSISHLQGNISVEYEVEEGVDRLDSDEITPSIDPAGYEKGLVGYCEDERLKRRDEILNTPNTLELYDIKGTVYYISTKGNDNNDGLSPETPIQTLFAIDSLPLQAGDAVLFERGCIWRLTETLVLKSGVTFGSYGEGRKPMILGSAMNFAREKWEPANKKNVWKITYIYAYPGGIFFDEGKEIGYQKRGLRDLKSNTDYYCNPDNATLYIYCDKGNPSKAWRSIEVSQMFHGITIANGSKGSVVDNIALRYTGIHGIRGAAGCENMTITNCEIGFNGGGWQGGLPGQGGYTRYGNSVESWLGGYGFTINHNWIYQNFDTGVSPQGQDSKKYGPDYENISICDSLFEYNNGDLEFWDTPGSSGMCLFINTLCDNNIHRFTALGWGTRANDGGIRGIDGLIFGSMALGQLKSMSFSNNIIDCPGTHMYKFGIASYGEYQNFKRVGNVFHIKQSYRWTTALISRPMVWKDEKTLVSDYAASTKSETLKAFAEFEPNATVHWYK